MPAFLFVFRFCILNVTIKFFLLRKEIIVYG